MNLSQQFRKGFTAIIQKTRLFNEQQQLIPLIETIADDKPKQQISAYQQHLDKNRQDVYKRQVYLILRCTHFMS